MKTVASSVAANEGADTAGSGIHLFTGELPFRFRLAEEDSRGFLKQWQYSVSEAPATIHGGETRRYSFKRRRAQWAFACPTIKSSMDT